jgi:nitrogen fixation/metabolism regulation signal transduction histidine kinase
MVSVKRRLIQGSWLLFLLGLLGPLVTALVLLSGTLQNSAYSGRLYSWLLLSSTVGLFSLAVLIVYQLYRLFRQYRARVSGARLTLRLVVIFIAIALSPVAVVYYFSLQFLQKGIDSWFDVRVEKSLEDALELSRTALDLRMREVLRQTLRIAAALGGVNQTQVPQILGELLSISDITELTLFSSNGQIVATANVDPAVMMPKPLPEGILLQVREGQDYVALDPVRDAGFYIRAVVRVPVPDSPTEERLLQALFPVAGRFSVLADSVQAAFDNYKELVFLRTPLKTSFILTLSLVMLFAVLTAFWVAVYSARRLVEPVRDLAAGTQAVAAGEYDKQLPYAGNDELGFLVDSFNEMTRKLAQTRDSARYSQQLLEQQRAYLEAVLARLSSGVLTLDHDGRLRTFNIAATQLLGVDLSLFSGAGVADISAVHPPLQPLLEAIDPQRHGTAGEWRREVTLFGNTGRRVLVCRGSSLPDPMGLKGGYVIVLDDITTLVQAERHAAWSEVARRLAHEIKNPLTPIQLAAERIRYKYLKMLDEEQARVLERGTHTIILQVQALKEMVDAFNEYARPPQLQLAPVALNDFITEVLYLYREYPAGVEIQLDLDPLQPAIEADKGRLRQLVHNVVKNAIEALKGGQGSTLQVSTCCGREADARYVELIFQDDGVGFPEGDMGDIFEPYVTTKPKGTGLGLAIVKKIVEEHGGVIRAEAPAEGGARIVIRFPLRAVAVAPNPITPITLAHAEEVG